MLKVGKNRLQISPGIKIGQGVFFSAGQSVQPPAAPVAISATNVLETGFTANWNASAGATGYYLDLSTQSDFSSFVSGYENKDVGADIFEVITGLNVYTTYYYRVRAYNAGGTSANSNTISQQTNYNPTADTEIFDWWNAQENYTVALPEGEVVSWTGEVAGNTANPPTVTSRPLYGTDQINSLDVLTFRSADPNYIEIDVSFLGSNCCLYMVVQGDASGSTQYLVCNSISTSNRIAKSGTTSTSIVGLGSSITVYQNGLSVYDQTMTRTQLDTLISSNSLVTFDGLDFTGVNTIYLFVRDNLGNAINGLLADVIISTGNTFISENNNFLINKYGF